MPSTRPASPVDLPPHRPEPLKRSHSSASIHSLPTPPPTRKRKRSRSTHSRATDSDPEIDEHDASEEEEEVLRHKAEAKGAVHVGSKKRKLLQVDLIAAELSGRAAEDDFWSRPFNTLGGKTEGTDATSTKAGPASSTRRRSESPQRSPSASPPARLLKRNRTGLLSPPQSKRKSSPRVKRFAVPPLILEEPEEEVEDAPKTPTRLRTPPPKAAPVPQAPKKGLPERDTPNNPFLDSDESSAVTETPDAESAVAGPSSIPGPKVVEKPTITYVFRGVRTEFINPLYDPEHPETGVDPSAEALSTLPVEHEDFEPSEHILPKRLFAAPKKPSRRRRDATPPGEASAQPAAKKPRAKGKAPAPKQKSERDTSDEEDNAPEEPVALALPRTPPPRRSPRLAGAQAKAAAAEPRATLRLPAKDRSDPAKRAFGVHDKPAAAAAPRARVEEVRAVRTETRVKVVPATPRRGPAGDESDAVEEVHEVREVRETTHVKVASRVPARPAAPRAKARSPPKAAAVPVEDAEENPFL